METYASCPLLSHSYPPLQEERRSVTARISSPGFSYPRFSSPREGEIIGRGRGGNPQKREGVEHCGCQIEYLAVCPSCDFVKWDTGKADRKSPEWIKCPGCSHLFVGQAWEILAELPIRAGKPLRLRNWATDICHLYGHYKRDIIRVCGGDELSYEEQPLVELVNPNKRDKDQ